MDLCLAKSLTQPMEYSFESFVNLIVTALEFLMHNVIACTHRLLVAKMKHLTSQNDLGKEDLKN
jgi:hypothetical protein